MESSMNTLILYSTIVGGFFSQSDSLNRAIDSARRTAGDDVWKRGYSGNDPEGATRIAQRFYDAEGVSQVKPEGVLECVEFVTNSDAAGNAYPKLRVHVRSNDDQLMRLSIDMKTDVAQRLIGKLDNCYPGQKIKISAWPTTIERNGRTFVNHAVSVKDEDGKEVPVNKEFSEWVKETCDAVEATLNSAGITDKKLIATAKVNKRVECFTNRLIEIQETFRTSVQEEQQSS
jgi:hypothetical protein